MTPYDETSRTTNSAASAFAAQPQAPTQPNIFGVASLAAGAVSLSLVAAVLLVRSWSSFGAHALVGTAGIALILGCIGIARSHKHPLRRGAAIAGVAIGGSILGAIMLFVVLVVGLFALGAGHVG